MPKPLNADWDACKALYTTGVTLKAVAVQTGVSYVALRARSHREGWSQLALETSRHLQQITHATFADRARAWSNRVADLMERRLAHLESLDPAKLKLSELEALTRITEQTDRIGRRTFGLDGPQTEQTAKPLKCIDI